MKKITNPDIRNRAILPPKKMGSYIFDKLIFRAEIRTTVIREKRIHEILKAKFISYDYHDLTPIKAIMSSFDTGKKFSSTDSKDTSPIEDFINNTNSLNKLITEDYNPVLGTLLLLGYVSASESYFRSLIRNLITIDPYIKNNVSDKKVSFAAAIHHSNEMLPEALLEDFSFASPFNIIETLVTMIGIKKIDFNDALRIREEFKKVCELRHCCVHRFGKLGSKNAVQLGIDDHKSHLERTINLSIDDIYDIAEITSTFIKTFNNIIFKFIMDRIVTNKNGDAGGTPYYQEKITWDYEKDKERFNRYFRVFQVNDDSTMPAHICYEKLKEHHQKQVSNTQPKRKKRS
ncbi:hypothetical protein ACK311_06665 [Aeromonas caviae]|uniref:hypothetical protein n=1 Tax=Aeromonas caviae TaxID=648 RepID=UPI0038CFEEC6